MMLSRWMVLLLLIGLSGCSGLKLQLEVQRDNQTLRVSAQQALGPRDRVALQLQVPQDSFVYLAHSPAQRDTRPIYPVTGPLRLSAGKLHRVPEDGSFLPLEDVKNGESLCVILSPMEIKGAMPRCVSTGGPSRDGSCGKDCEPKKTKAEDRGPEGLTIVPLHLSQCIPANGALNDVELVTKVQRSRFGCTDQEQCSLRDETALFREPSDKSPLGIDRNVQWTSSLS